MAIGGSFKDKDVSILVDFDELERQTQNREEAGDFEDFNSIGVRSTILSLGKDKRVSSKEVISTPEIVSLEKQRFAK